MMRTSINSAIFLLGVSMVWLWLSPTTFAQHTDLAPAGAARSGFVVAELFTSQGCSSCPAADSVLRGLKQRASSEGVEIVPLSYHIEYWDYLGWEDPYGTSLATTRQREYGAALGTKLFTPQLIINGSRSLVGSQRDTVYKEVHSALTQSGSGKLELQSLGVTDGVLSIQADYLSPYQRSVLNILAVKSDGSNYVPRGENSGRKLTHANIVRSMKRIELMQPSGVGKFRVDLPKDVDIVVGLLQDPKTLKILAQAVRPLR